MKILFYVLFLLLSTNGLFAVNHKNNTVSNKLLMPNLENEKNTSIKVTEDVENKELKDDSNSSTNVLKDITKLAQDFILPTVLKIGKFFSKTEYLSHQIEVLRDGYDENKSSTKEEKIVLSAKLEDNQSIEELPNNKLTVLNDVTSMDFNMSQMESTGNPVFKKSSPQFREEETYIEEELAVDFFEDYEMSQEEFYSPYVGFPNSITGELESSNTASNSKVDDICQGRACYLLSNSLEEEPLVDNNISISETIESVNINENGTITIRGHANFSDLINIEFKGYEIINFLVENEDGSFEITSEYEHEDLDFTYFVEDTQGNRTQSTKVVFEGWYMKEEVLDIKRFKLLTEPLQLAKGLSSISVHQKELEDQIIVEFENAKENQFIEVKHQAFGEDREDCKDVNYVAYMKLLKHNKVLTGFKLEGENCGNQQDPTIMFNEVSSKSIHAELLATTQEEKEQYGKSNVVIVIDYELNNEFMIIGN
ncbi:MAG: Unknown protein [uncultured Sulfurovum sp.]|uniref:Uncharacterized protein n=1 Tax=uncultured Sulfurovum sp. TaxID=269237 RepID=A0A6S6T7T8_9BACT|nr:MAG: Unknown protein [uncultured Sulfurovum sp.]